MIDAVKLGKLYKAGLLDDVVPFWLNYSPDREQGGYFTCLERNGEVFDTDKFIWLQARQVWTFAMLYVNVEKRSEWLAAAEAGARFLLQRGRAENGYWYFSLTREGAPLVQPYNIFSDCFAAMAFGKLYEATGNNDYATVARDTFYNILKRQEQAKGIYNKAVPGTRPLKNFALPMILCNLVLELEPLLEPSLVEDTIRAGIDAVMKQFYRPDQGIILENIRTDGGFSDSFDGRVINPGHGLEAMWFIMDLAKRKGDDALIRRATDIALQLVECGWDAEHGGIFYFLDVLNKPLQQLEWDQKLWWVHIETMITLAKGYLHTGDGRCAQWFQQLHDYTWQHFPDPEYGEWFGYLNREGKPLLSLKGGKWKGCFHVPRGLFQLWKTMEAIEQKYPAYLLQTK
ncbi:AGE family epimerase/isomerase [Niabella drilacis]|uniref:N-acylglucosamine 2-epimerase n=1 Tax=Niabella drilacis (strain DSM 25811 / CCM 8410 / CCUG 62505 / LMG 26954 / E90) TaxID=1285928 RepID=A0A1G6M3X9_NIADE|nr:AGE family epimerase/isomerase [Niabella drilacis]SDC50242.1 N-acylglucosamine 2-epimerase [Niabella drilacis]